MRHAQTRRCQDTGSGGAGAFAAATTYGVSRRAVNKWGAIDKVGGLRGLKPKRRGRLCGIVFAGKFTAPVFAAFLQRLRLFRMPGYGPELNP